MTPDTQLDLLELPPIKKTVAQSVPANLWLPRKVKAQATKVAFDRYDGATLSQMVTRLLVRECELKRGLLKKKAR